MERRRETVAVWLVAAATALIATKTIGELVRHVGHAAVTLDDAYIHFQYARAIAEGHPLRYQAGEPISTGATSALWPLLLAPFYGVGFRDVALAWPAWALSFAALGLLAWDAAALVKPLAGTIAAATTAALVLSFGGHVWCAASGMEVVPFAWTIARTLRRASEWAEGQRDRRRLVEIAAASSACALLRPEGFVFAVVAAIVLAIHPPPALSVRGVALPRRVVVLAPLALPAFAVAVVRIASGSALTNTALAKLLFYAPYTQGAGLRRAVAENFRTFFVTLLNGEVWATEFLPSGGALIAVLGVASIGVLAWPRGKSARGALILLFAAAMLIPCFYVTFLWNRLRYLWPFATGWLIGLACFAHVLGLGAKRLGIGSRIVEPLIGGALVGLVASKLPWVIDDVAQSASGIDRQQVAAGRWARANLPADARIGMNDAGAIAYFSDRKTFDVVGLTTSGEARYWLAGPASRFEHYEKLAPALRPTHFIVYPEWFGTDAVLGKGLVDFTVNDATILGGRTKRVYLADWSLLGSGEAPWTEVSGDVVDTLDVADLESEEAHRYSLEAAREGEQIVLAAKTPAGARIADGGRGERVRERFVVKLTAGAPHRAIVRLDMPVDTSIRLTVGSAPPVEAKIASDGDWTEAEFAFTAPGPSADVTLEASDPVTIFHYWFVAARP